MIHRRTFVMLVLISLAFLAFFGHTYIMWIHSNASISESPQPQIFVLSQGLQQNVSENFNFYGSSLMLTEYSNVTFKIPSYLANNLTITTSLNVKILRESKSDSPIVVFNRTYDGTNTLNSTTVRLKPGNYLLMSSLSILLNSVNYSTVNDASIYIYSTLKSTAFVNADLNSYPYLIAIPTYLFIIITFVLFIATYIFFSNDYDIRHR